MFATQRGYTSTGIIWFILWLLCVIGWVKNIIALIAMVDLPVTGMFIFRIVGIFAFPIGAILGWFA